jgi:hypothetical protein
MSLKERAEMKSKVVQAIRLMKVKPTVFLGAFRTDNYNLLRDVLSELIDERTILFTSDRYLELPGEFTPTA